MDVGLPDGSDDKASTYNVGDPGLILGLGRSPGEGNGNPLGYSCLENESHGRRSLVTYSPWGHGKSGSLQSMGSQRVGHD